MALSTGNLVTPQQTALTNKLNPNPFSALSNPATRPMPQAGSAPFTQPLPKPNIGGAISGAIGAVGNAFNSMPKPTAVPRPSYMPQAPVMNLAGLLTPPQPQLGSVGTSPVTSHTVTTKPDGTMTHKVTHATPESTANAGQASSVIPPEVNPNSAFQTNTGNAPQGTPPPTSPQPPSNSQYSQTNPPTYSGLISSLANTSSQPSQGYTDAIQKAEGYNQALEQSRINEAKGLADNASNPIPLEFQQGRGQILQNQYTQEQNALGAAYQGASNLASAANTQQGLQQTALYNAAGLAAPKLASYNEQAFNPITGQFNGGGSMNDAVAAIVEKLKNGQMSYKDATDALSGYGQGGINALQAALPPGFNVNQSNTLASTQGAVGPAVQYAGTALDTLTNAIQNLSVPGQGSNIPIAGQIGNFISSVTGIGGEKTQALKSAVAEARAALTNVFIQKGVTPTAAGDQANALIPDNPTPQQIAAAKQTLATFGQSTQNIYGNPGQAGSASSSTSTTTSAGGWGSLGD